MIARRGGRGKEVVEEVRKTEGGREGEKGRKGCMVKEEKAAERRSKRMSVDG